MAQVKIIKREIAWTPANSQVNENSAQIAIEVGEVILYGTIRVTEGFDGTNAALELETNGGVDIVAAASIINVANTNVTGQGSNGINTLFFESAGTININYTSDGDGTLATGAADLAVFVIDT